MFFFFMFRDVPECSGMFWHVPECSMFRVLSTPRFFGVWYFRFRDIFWLENFGRYFLGLFKTIWRLEIVPTYPGCVVPRIDYFGSKIQHGISEGWNFGPGIFLHFVWSPRDFRGFWFLPPFDHPCHLKCWDSRAPTPGLYMQPWQCYRFFCLFYDRKRSNKNLEIQRVTYQK